MLDDFLWLRWPALLLVYTLTAWVVIHALLHKSDPRSALGWTAAVVFLPLVGSVVYFIFGIERADSRASRLMREAALLAKGRRDSLHGGEDSSHPPGYLDEEEIKTHYPLARIGLNITGRALVGGNSVRPLFDGEQAYPEMLKAIAKARDHVYMATYIFNHGEYGMLFAEAMAKAAGRGVDVRLVVDGFGGTVYSWRNPWKSLAQHGVKVARFLPLRLFPPNFSINLRNHRKVLVCDEIGFTGGMNIADYHMASRGRGYRVRDVHFACRGPVVAQLREAFLLDFGFATGTYDEPDNIYEPTGGWSACRMVMDGPGSGGDPLHDLICGTIGGARERVLMMTPYFLPTREIIAALRATSLRGTEVKIVLPAKNNLFYMQWASIHILPNLMKAGVRFFMQPPPFAHSKLLLVDNEYSLIGSANMDPRSLRLNFEMNMEVFDPMLNNRLKEHFVDTMAKSREITARELLGRPLPVKLRNAFCWLFSPYL